MVQGVFLGVDNGTTNPGMPFFFIEPDVHLPKMF